MSAETNRLVVLTGISGEKLIETELSTYGDVAATRDEEMQALERSGKITAKQQQKVKAVRDYLLESEVIEEGTTMEGIFAYFYNKKLPQLPQAFTVSFTVLRDNRNADGLRKLCTIAARKRNGFYTEIGKSTQSLHNEAFKSESVPDQFDFTGWEANMSMEAATRDFFL